MSDAAVSIPEDGSMTALTDSADSRQFVIFHVADEMFAVPLSEVHEIIRMPVVVPVPMSPGALDGLANLRGIVLPVINLRRIFGMAVVADDDATRVVILDHGRPLGLVVDRVANVVTVDSDRIEAVDGIQGTVDTDLMTGMIKGADGAGMVMVLDAKKIIAREFQAIAGAARQALVGDLGRPSEGPGDDATVDKSSDVSQLVSFEVAGQEYALPIEQVQEIVQIPPTITHVPNAPSHVIGVMTLRNRLLPVVSLRDLFGLPSEVLSDSNKIVVVSLGADRRALFVGVMMDSVKEVLRVGRSVIDAVPALLSRDGKLGEIQAICRLNEGKRLVSILSSERLFNAGDLGALLDRGAGEKVAMSEEGLSRRDGVVDDEEQFVVFRLRNEEYGVPIALVQEIVRIPEELTRVPKTPDFLEGVINLRGVILPVVDQRRRFGLPSMERNDRQRIMVYLIGGVRTGFIVDQVLEVMRISAAVIGPSPSLSAEQQRLIRRVANIEQQKRMILLLDIEQLLDSGETAVVQKAAA